MKRIKDFFAGHKTFSAVSIVFVIILSLSILSVFVKSSSLKASFAADSKIDMIENGLSRNENTSDLGSRAPKSQEQITSLTGADIYADYENNEIGGTIGLSPAQPAQEAMQLPSSKTEILAFYKKAVDRIAENGEAGYKVKAWRTLESVDTKNEQSDNIFKTVAALYLTSEIDATEEVFAKDSNQAKDRFPACAMTDDRFIQDARCEIRGDNYYITLVVKDDDTPRKNRNHLGQITNSLLYWEDISGVIKKIKMIESIDESKTHIYYDNFTINCVISKSGEFISLTHSSNVYVSATGTVNLIKYYDLTIDAHFRGQSNYYGFEY